jgi:ABC-type antimicrobial peptide transport system, ATPase component
LLKLKEISKIYEVGDHIIFALRKINLEVREGEFVTVMGPSGSGKSTMMNILGCLDKPTKGEYLLDGIEVSTLTFNELAVLRNLKIGFVFQGFNLLPRTTALENVELPLLYAGVKTKERRRRALEALESVGLSSRVNHRPKELSGGQQQRVAIARALVNNPKIILADEPTGNLDSQTTEEIMAIFQSLSAAGGTILLVSHEPEIALYSQRIVRFLDGQISGDEQVAAPHIARAHIVDEKGAAS